MAIAHVHVVLGPWFDFINCFAPHSCRLRQYKASQKLGVERKLLGAGPKSVYEIDPISFLGSEPF